MVWWWGGLEDDGVVRGTNEQEIVLCTRDQRKRDLAPTQNHPHPNCTTSRGPSDLRARTVHLCSVAGGPSMFAESGNSSGGGYAIGCKTAPLWYGGGGVEYGAFSQCSAEKHSVQQRALSYTTTTNHNHHHRSTTTTTGTSKVLLVVVRFCPVTAVWASL